MLKKIIEIGLLTLSILAVSTLCVLAMYNMVIYMDKQITPIKLAKPIVLANKIKWK